MAVLGALVPTHGAPLVYVLFKFYIKLICECSLSAARPGRKMAGCRKYLHTHRGIVLPQPAIRAAENIVGWFDQPPCVRYAMKGLRTVIVQRTPCRVGFLEIIYYS